MFTWICPKCGREVPPAYDECPDCARAQEQGAAGAPPPQAGMQAPPVQGQPTVPSSPPAPQIATQYAPPAANTQQPAYSPQGYPQQPAYNQQAFPPIPQPQYYPPPKARRSFPAWLLTLITLVVFAGVAYGVYWIVNRGHGQAAPPSTVESPAAKAGAATNPLQKYIEVSGVRFMSDPKKKDVILAKFLLTNHSQADLSGLAGNVTIWGRTQKSEEEAQGTFTFSTNLGPLESKEVTAPVTTKYKIYELPDWQNVNPDLQITAPAPSLVPVQ